MATTTQSIWRASTPAASSACLEDSTPISWTVSSAVAQRRCLMPDRCWIHSSLESIASMMSALGMTREGGRHRPRGWRRASRPGASRWWPSAEPSGWGRWSTAAPSPCFSQKARLVELVGRLERERLDALEGTLRAGQGAAAGGSSRIPVTPRSDIVPRHRSQRTGFAIWPTSRVQDLGAAVDDLPVAGWRRGSAGRAPTPRQRAWRGGRPRGPCARCGRRPPRSAG